MKKLLVGCMLLGVPGVVAVGNLAYVPEAEARPGRACTTDYYSDDTYSQPVGTRFCGCSIVACTMSGQQSEYAVTECELC